MKPAALIAIIMTATVAILDGAQEQRIRLRVEGVAVSVTVRQGRAPVGGLTGEDFELTDNGVAQTVRAVSLESTPLDLTVVLDASGSMAGDAADALRKDVDAIGRMLGQEDRLRIVTFATRATEILPMQQWSAATQHVEFHSTGATAFFHALTAALLHQTTAGRPHLVVAISDAADNMSLLDGADVEGVARHSDAVLYVVQRQHKTNVRGTAHVLRWGWVPYGGYNVIGAVREAVEGTGGRLFAEQVDRPLPEVFKRTLADVRTGYVLWFTPTGVAKSGWHDLSVRVKGRRYDVTARRGYFGG